MRTRSPGGGRKPILTVSVSYVLRISDAWLEPTYRLGAMKHADVEIPKAQPAIFANTSKSVVSIVATPRIKRYRCHPGLVALATRHNGRVDDRPDGNQVVLASRQYVLAIWGPGNADKAAIVRVVKVQQPGNCQPILQNQTR